MTSATEKIHLKFDRRRNLNRMCPCEAHSNRDGKFSHFDGYPDCGYCHSCGEVFLPPQMQGKEYSYTAPGQLPPQKYFSATEVAKSIAQQHRPINYFYQFLSDLIGESAANNLFDKYKIGTGKRGNTLFWQFDDMDRAINAKSIYYNPQTGKRNKTYPPKLLRSRDDGYSQALFGTHLIRGNKLPIAMVESEKTAVLCAHVWPERLWIASCGSTAINKKKLAPLAGRQIDYYVDADKAGRLSIIRTKQAAATAGVDIRFFDPAPTSNEGTDLGDIAIDYLLNNKKKNDAESV